MKINSIYIKDFRNIKEINLELKDNKIILISGDTGEGKSSILEAVIYVLTDYLKIKIEKCIRWYQEEFIIKVNFEHLGSIYNYEIVGKPKGSQKTLTVNNQDEYRNTEATQYMKEHVCNPILTLYSAIAMQGESSSILFETSSKRLEKLKQIFGIEKINLISENMKADIQANEQEVVKIEAELNVFKNLKFDKEFIEDLPNINYEESKIQYEQLKKDKEIFAIEHIKQAQFERDLKSYLEAQDNIRFAIDENIVYEEEINNIKFHNITEFDLKEYTDLGVSIIDLKQKIKLYEDNSKRKKTFEKKLEGLILNRLPRLQYNKEKIEEFKKEIVDLKQYIRDRKVEFDLAEKGLCPICGKVYEADSKAIKEIIDKDKKLLEDYENILVEAEQEWQEYENKKKANDIIQVQRELIQNEINQLEIKDTLIDKDELEVLEIKKENLEKIRLENIRLSNENNKLQIQKTDLKNKILINETNIQNYEKVVKPEDFKFSVTFNKFEFEEIENEILEYEKIKNENDRKEKHNEYIKKQEIENSLLINDKQNKVDDYRHLNVKLSVSKKILEKEFSSYLIDKGSNYIKEKMNQFFQRAYGKYVIDFKQDGKGIDFFYSEDEKLFIEVEAASGFEKEILAMAFRIALNELQNLGILFLDEIDSFASDDRSKQLYETLFTENFNQLFFISHNEATKEFITNDYNALQLQIKEGEII